MALFATLRSAFPKNLLGNTLPAVRAVSTGPSKKVAEELTSAPTGQVHGNKADHLATRDFDRAFDLLYNFFKSRGFKHTFVQNRVSILAACEQPENIVSYQFKGRTRPLPQTGQMWLEHEILEDPSLDAITCMTTSYRNEENPIPGRHNNQFALFEFESLGDNLTSTLSDLVGHLGFKNKPVMLEYQKACEELGVESIEAKEEGVLAEKYGPVIFLCKFPIQHSFFNMAANPDGTSTKIDVLLHGAETFGTALRSTDTKAMVHNFESLAGGEYSKTLYKTFGVDDTNAELQVFLNHNMKARFGGGIGVNRLITAMKKEGLL